MTAHFPVWSTDRNLWLDLRYFSSSTHASHCMCTWNIRSTWYLLYVIYIICNIIGETKQRRMRWLGHKGNNKITCWKWHPIEFPKLPYTEHHMAREKRDRQRTTRRRIITSELEEMGFLWARLSTLQRT